MPLVRISVRKGRPPEVRRRIADRIQAALAGILEFRMKTAFGQANVSSGKSLARRAEDK